MSGPYWDTSRGCYVADAKDCGGIASDIAEMFNSSDKKETKDELDMVKAELTKVKAERDGLRAMADWNYEYPPGTEVILTDDLGHEHETKTESVAWVLRNGEPLVMVEGRVGGYLLSRLRPIVCDAAKEEKMKTLTERRAEFVYDAARLAAIAAKAPIVPVPWSEREQAFREQFLKVIDRQCGEQRSKSPEELHGSWMQSYFAMGWVYGEKYDREKKIHPDLVPYADLGQLERDKDSVFVALCEIARQWVYDGELTSDE